MNDQYPIDQVRRQLHERFPECIAKRGGKKRPLKLGIVADILKAMPSTDPILLELALDDYTTGIEYLKAVLEGAQRVDLQGRGSGYVTRLEANAAMETLQKHAIPNMQANAIAHYRRQRDLSLSLLRECAKIPGLVNEPELLGQITHFLARFK